MGDPIKEKLKQDTLPTKIKDAIKENLRQDNSSVSKGNAIIRRAYEIGNPIQLYGSGPGLAELQLAVKKVNEGQKNLEIIRKMEKSPTYRSMVTTYDSFRGIFGKNVNRVTDIYEIFTTQQHNIRGLNYVLASLTSSCEEDVTKSRKSLDSLLMDTKDEKLRKKEIENEELPPEIQRYEDAESNIKAISKESNPDKFYSALQDVIDAKRMSRQKRFEWAVAAIGGDHHDTEIDSLLLQEELFETLLYRTMEMSYQTELYQKTLDRQVPIWKKIDILSTGVKSVGGAVGILADYNAQIQEGCLQCHKEVSQIVNNHPGKNQIINANNELRKVVADVNNSSWQEVSQYQNDQ
jgi:hypothetical protein